MASAKSASFATLLGVSFSCALTAASARASADERALESLTSPLGFTVGLERVLYFGPYTQDGPRGESGVSAAAGPYLRSSELDEGGEPFLPHAAPRLTFDLVLPWRITAGLGAGYGISVAPAKDYSGISDPPLRELPTTLFTGRLGYMHRVGKDGLFWIRMGLSYASGEGSHTSTYYSDLYETTIRHYSLPLEFVFVFPVARHFGIVFSPSLDLGLYGTDNLRTSIGGPGPGGLPATENEVRRVNDAFGLWLGLIFFR
jgi:hypothetical protein